MLSPGPHEALLWHTGALVPWSSKTPQWSPGLHAAPLRHNGPLLPPAMEMSWWHLGFLRPPLCHNWHLVPWAAIATQCLLGSIRPHCDTTETWFHKIPLHHNGALGSMRLHFVTVDTEIQEEWQCQIGTCVPCGPTVLQMTLATMVVLCFPGVSWVPWGRFPYLVGLGGLWWRLKVFLASEHFNFVLGACTVMMLLGLSGSNQSKFFILWLIGLTFANFS